MESCRSLRVFEKTDVVMLLLLRELGIEIPTDPDPRDAGLPGDRVLVPYDRDGRYGTCEIILVLGSRQPHGTRVGCARSDGDAAILK